MTPAPPIRELTVERLLEALEEPMPSPAGGSAAAVAAASAASLVRLVALASAEWPEARGVAAQAAVRRDRLVELADADAAAFAAALEALREAKEAGRSARLGAALALAADVPLAIAEAAGDVVALAGLAASEGRPELRPDAVVARELAAAATRASAVLVEVNLATQPGDERTARAAAAVEAAEAW